MDTELQEQLPVVTPVNFPYSILLCSGVEERDEEIEKIELEDGLRVLLLIP